MEQPSSTTIQRKHENKCKTQENTPQNQEELKAAEFPVKPNLGEYENGDEEKKREEEEKWQKFYLFFSHLIGLYKEKK